MPAADETIVFAKVAGIGESSDVTPVNTGDYSLAEAAHQGTDANDYSLTSLSCTTNDGDPFTPANDSGHVGDGQDLVCTFLNPHHAGTLEPKKRILGAPR